VVAERLDGSRCVEVGVDYRERFVVETRRMYVIRYDVHGAPWAKADEERHEIKGDVVEVDVGQELLRDRGVVTTRAIFEGLMRRGIVPRCWSLMLTSGNGGEGRVREVPAAGCGWLQGSTFGGMSVEVYQMSAHDEEQFVVVRCDGKGLGYRSNRGRGLVSINVACDSMSVWCPDECVMVVLDGSESIEMVGGSVIGLPGHVEVWDYVGGTRRVIRLSIPDVKCM
jgi:hypothetical protein